MPYDILYRWNLKRIDTNELTKRKETHRLGEHGHQGKGWEKGIVRQFRMDMCDFPGGSDGKASACNAGDPASIPGYGRSPGEGNSNPLQYSCLENPMDGGT